MSWESGHSGLGFVPLEKGWMSRSGAGLFYLVEGGEILQKTLKKQPGQMGTWISLRCLRLGRPKSWEFWVFSRICPNLSQQLDPTNPLILWIGTEGGEEPPALPTLMIFLEIYNFPHPFHKIPAVGCRGWWEKTQKRRERRKER